MNTTDRKCCCPSDDARDCLRIRTGRYRFDFDDEDELAMDERCECHCHVEHEQDRREFNPEPWEERP